MVPKLGLDAVSLSVFVIGPCSLWVRRQLRVPRRTYRTCQSGTVCGLHSRIDRRWVSPEYEKKERMWSRET